MYIVITDQHLTCATTTDKQKAIDYVKRLNEQGVEAEYMELEEE